MCSGHLRPGLVNCASRAQCGLCADGFRGWACQVDMALVHCIQHGGGGPTSTLATLSSSTAASEYDRQRWWLMQFNTSVMDTLGIPTGLELLLTRHMPEDHDSIRIDVCLWEDVAHVFNTSAAVSLCFLYRLVPTSLEGGSVSSSSESSSPAPATHTQNVLQGRGLNLSVGLWVSSAFAGIRLSQRTSSAAASTVSLVVTATATLKAPSLSQCIAPAVRDDSSSGSAASLTTTTSPTGLLCTVCLEGAAVMPSAAAVSVFPVPSSVSTAMVLVDASAGGGEHLSGRSLAFTVIFGIALGLLVAAYRSRQRSRPAYAALPTARRRPARRDGDDANDSAEELDGEVFENTPVVAVGSLQDRDNDAIDVRTDAGEDAIAGE